MSSTENPTGKPGQSFGPQNSTPATDQSPDSAPAVSGQPPAASSPPSEEQQVVLVPAGVPKKPLLDTIWESVRDYFIAEPPTFWVAMVPMLALSAILFTRHPSTNYIFDEQEALLANPFVNGKADKLLPWIDAFRRDFWGLPAERSVGSYRPIPNFVWRTLWHLSQAPWLHHWFNVLLHAANGACIVVLVHLLTKRRGMSWLAGAIFTASAILTEAVSGVVGIADVLGGLGALLALLALTLPMGWMTLAVFAAVLFGLLSKESALVCVPLVPFAALIVAPLTHPDNPRRFSRAILSFVGATAAFVIYVELRKRLFPAPIESQWTTELPEGSPLTTRLHHDFMAWFHQPILPRDPLNNPLVKADPPLRYAGALRVYWRGLVQVVIPKTLSGDYSFPQEPVPETPWFFESIAGAACLVMPPLMSLGLWLRGLWVERKARLSSSQENQSEDDDDSDEDERTVWWRAPLLATHEVRLAALSALTTAGVLLWALCRAMLQLRPDPEKLVEPIPEETTKLIALIDKFALAQYAFAAIALAAGIALLVFAVRNPSEEELVIPQSREPLLPSGEAMLLLVAVGITWIVVSYFPHSNIPALLPTVRAERFWYFPVIGSSIVLAVFFTWLFEKTKGFHDGSIAVGLFTLFFTFQCGKAFMHSRDYRDDLVFWDATRYAVPNSSKAHLNYSVMQGARGRLDIRRESNARALELAPEWPMAHVYMGDTICRMHKPEEAWPYYESGFKLADNDPNLLSLGLQCMWDEQVLTEDGETKRSFHIHQDELLAMCDERPGSWLNFLVRDMVSKGEENNGVDPKYRPRGYNEGPKE